MSVKNYLINDKWLDIDKQNIVEVKSTDGVIGSIKLNGEEYGGGGSSDFSTAQVAIHILQGTPTFNSVFILPTDDPSHPYYMATGTQDFNNGDIIQCVLYSGEGFIDISLLEASSASGTGNVEIETVDNKAFATITGDCTITIS